MEESGFHYSSQVISLHQSILLTTKEGLIIFCGLPKGPHLLDDRKKCLSCSSVSAFIIQYIFLGENCMGDLVRRDF